MISGVVRYEAARRLRLQKPGASMGQGHMTRHWHQAYARQAKIGMGVGG